MFLVDTNILFDILNDDPDWADWSQDALESAIGAGRTAINDIIYAELSVRFESAEQVDAAVHALGLQHATIPKTALLLAGKAFQRDRSRGGTKFGALSDFFIGAHVSVENWTLLTRDAARQNLFSRRQADRAVVLAHRVLQRRVLTQRQQIDQRLVLVALLINVVGVFGAVLTVELDVDARHQAAIHRQ